MSTILRIRRLCKYLNCHSFSFSPRKIGILPTPEEAKKEHCELVWTDNVPDEASVIAHEESHHNGDSYDESSRKVPIGLAELQAIEDELYSMALEKAEEQIKKMDEESRKRHIKNHLDESLRMIGQVLDEESIKQKTIFEFLSNLMKDTANNRLVLNEIKVEVGTTRVPNKHILEHMASGAFTITINGRRT